MTANHRSDGGGTHAHVSNFRFTGRENCFIRQPQRVGQGPGNRRWAGERVAVQMKAVAVVGFTEIAQHHIHGHFAGDFTGGLSAHAVTHNKDAVARVITEVIFVILAYTSDIGFACNFHCQRHAMSVMKRITISFKSYFQIPSRSYFQTLGGSSIAAKSVPRTVPNLASL